MNINFAKEYNDLVIETESVEKYMTGNVEKDRYGNIAPSLNNRVTLTDMKLGDETYINADYVGDDFINTQAPVPSSINDFWRMVWENNCSLIIMLTDLQENNRVKADRYWPSTYKKETHKYGEITVSGISCRLFEDMIVREFTMKVGNEERKLTHIFYATWPDHGVPKVESFFHLVNLYFSLKTDNRTVVHCSAGCGRTGVFTAIALLLQQSIIKLNVYETVKQVRTERPCSIQTSKQYKFIYDLIFYYIKRKTQ